MPVLKVEGLYRQFESVVAVRDANMELAENELVTILGPSGSGKTTLLRCIAGFSEPSAGRIVIDGYDVVNTTRKFFLPPEKRNIGMVFQSYAVWPHMDVFRNVAYPLRIRKLPKKEIETRTMEILRTVHLEHLAHRLPHEMSGGQQQRVALARALVMQPRLLLLDEPLSNLDAALREEMRIEIRELKDRLGITVVNVTHDQTEALTMSDKVVIMKDGVIVQQGTPKEIYDSPANVFVAKFIGSANAISCERIDSRGGKASVKIGDKVMDVTDEWNGEGTPKLVFRPHDVMLNEDGITGMVARKTYLGDRLLYTLKVGSEMVSICQDARKDIALGENIHFSILRALLLGESNC